MTVVLVVGSVALDSVETPFGKIEDAIGGSGTFFSASASHLTKVNLVGVVGNDFPLEKLEPLRLRGVDLAGRLERIADAQPRLFEELPGAEARLLDDFHGPVLKGLQGGFGPLPPVRRS
jgi:hypothetical protein